MFYHSSYDTYRLHDFVLILESNVLLLMDCADSWTD